MTINMDREMNNYRILFIPALEKTGTQAFTDTAETLAEARLKLDVIAKYTLHMHDKGIMPDYSNYGCIEQFVTGEWKEVEENA